MNVAALCPETGKQRYRSQYHAERKLESIVTMPVQESPYQPVRAYLCPHCDRWHLTSRKAAA